MSEIKKCELCGEPMPIGEQMFKYHGYSGDCPKPHLPKTISKLDGELHWHKNKLQELEGELTRLKALLGECKSMIEFYEEASNADSDEKAIPLWVSKARALREKIEKEIREP